MTHKIIRKTIFWKCDKCQKEYITREEAVKCEKQPPTKLPLNKGNTKTDYWDIGDMVISYYREDNVWMIGIIKETAMEYHYIVPVIETLDSPARAWGAYGFRNVILLDEDAKRKIRAWADIIMSHPNLVV